MSTCQDHRSRSRSFLADSRSFGDVMSYLVMSSEIPSLTASSSSANAHIFFTIWTLEVHLTGSPSTLQLHPRLTMLSLSQHSETQPASAIVHTYIYIYKLFITRTMSNKMVESEAL